MNTPLEPPMVGPKGGDLTKAFKPEWRKQELNGDESTLHRFEDDHDTTTGGVKNEQPWHRMAAYMLLAGRTNSEIAAAARVGTTQVSRVRQQKWFQDLLATIANVEGEEVIGLIKSESIASVEKLVSLRDNAESEGVQFTAAKTLLEHGTGKPVQMTLNATSRRSNQSPLEEMDSLKAQLQALRNRNQSPCPS